MVSVAESPETDGPGPRSRRPTRRGTWVAWIAGFLIVVVGAELGARVLEPRLPHARTYFSNDARMVAADMDVLHDNSVSSDITFTGTSMMRRDVAANDVEKLLGVKWAHNVALPGSQTPVTERWLLEEVIPRIHPKRVVWGIQSIDFNSGRDNKSIEQYNRARATQKGFYADADRALEASALSANREALRDPLTVQHALEGKARPSEDVRPLGDRAVWELGYPKITEKERKRLRAAHMREIKEHQLLNFRMGEEEIGAYVRTLRSLKDQGIETAVVIMPVPTTYIEAHPKGRADLDEFKRVATEKAKDAGVPVVDLSEAMKDEDFRDHEHLWAPQAREFTKLLAGKLQELGW